MKEQYINEIIDSIATLEENELLYILIFIQKLFGGH
jgi:hypothetical protein